MGLDFDYFRTIFGLFQDQSWNIFELDFDYFSLYPKNKNFTNQVEDAQILKKKIKEKNIKYIILDDYRFDKTWEKF